MVSNLGCLTSSNMNSRRSHPLSTPKTYTSTMRSHSHAIFICKTKTWLKRRVGRRRRRGFEICGAPEVQGLVHTRSLASHWQCSGVNKDDGYSGFELASSLQSLGNQDPLLDSQKQRDDGWGNRFVGNNMTRYNVYVMGQEKGVIQKYTKGIVVHETIPKSGL